MIEGEFENTDFLTPEYYIDTQAKRLESNRGRLLIASNRSGAIIADKVVQRYTELLKQSGSGGPVLYLAQIDSDFTDSETLVRLEHHVSGYDVFLFQSLFDPTSNRSVDDNYLAFLIAARAFKEHGANHVAGVLPYLAYARQDKPTRFEREATTARLMADLGTEAGVDRIIAWHPHTSQIYGFYGKTPVNFLDPLALFIQEFQHLAGQENVIVVAPDAGATKLVTHFCRLTRLNGAIASKMRPHPEEVGILDIIGEFKGKQIAIILDDMLSSGGTIYELTKKIVVEKGITDVYVCVSHNLCVGHALERLMDLYHHYNLRKLIITDSIPQPEAICALPFVKIRSLTNFICHVINRIHYNQSVSEIFQKSL
jgi:ribose-phosphate pyrophosphokinase